MGGSFWDKERSIGDHLPYLAQIDERTIMLRDGRLMQVIQLDGIAFETLDDEEIDYRTSMREAALRAIGSSQFAVYQHVIRHKVDHTLDGTFPDQFSAHLDAIWRARLETKQLFSNQLFLCVVRRPRPGRAGLVELIGRKLFARSDAEKDASQAEALGDLYGAVDSLASSLSQYGARMLQAYEYDGALYSELLEYLSILVNADSAPIVLPEGDVGHYLPQRRISFGAETVEFGDDAGTLKKFAGIISIKEYPGSTAPGFLDDLMRLPFEFHVTQSFAFVDRGAVLGRMNLAQRRMRAADDEALSLRAELTDAKDAVAAGRSVFGEHHLSIMVFADSEGEVAKATSEIQSTLSDLGLVSVREAVGLEPAFWAQFPGNFDYIGRRALISAGNFACLASLHNFALGQSENNHWGDAVTLLETTAAGPYHFNFHHGDLGNFTVIGPSGSGKTVVLNFLLAQSRRFDPRIVFFDKDRGAELFLRAIGGQYDILRPGVPSGLNPLKLADTPENRSLLADLIAQLVSIPGEALTAEENERIVAAVEANMQAPLEFRRMAHFSELLQGASRPRAGDLAARLAPWWGKGEHAWLFDNEDDLVDLNQKVIGFDMTKLLDDPALRTPAMMYLFHRIEERLAGDPTIIVIDEGWKALDDEVFTRRIKDWEKTIRKRNGIVGFATQSAEDALASSIATAIVEQAATQIFMPNGKAQEAAYKDGFGLTDHEYRLVKSLPDNARAFLIKHGGHSVVARLDLTAEKEMLTVLSGREKTVRLLDDMRTPAGGLPSDWLTRILEVAA